MKLQSYEKTPIYRRARDILRDTYRIANGMGKGYRYGLGARLSDYAQGLTEAVFLAYEERDDLSLWISHLNSVEKATQRMLINYRIANDLNQISRNDYAAQVETLIDVVKQTRGWKTTTLNAIARV